MENFLDVSTTIKSLYILETEITDFPTVHIQLFRERLSEKVCTRKVIWDTINNLFLTLQPSKFWLLLPSFSTRKHTSMASLTILSNCFEQQWTQNHPQYPLGLLHAVYPTTFLEIPVLQLVKSLPFHILKAWKRYTFHAWAEPPCIGLYREGVHVQHLKYKSPGFVVTLMLSAGLLISRARKSQISRDFEGRIRGKIGQFRGSFRGILHKKAIGKKRPILWLFSRQISLEIDRFCADQTSVFNVFLTEVIICSFNNNTLQK